MRIPLLVVITLAVFLLAGSAFAQSNGDGVFNEQGISDGCGDTMNPDECMFGDSAGGGGSGSGGGCSYCYHSSTAPYANCFSGISGLNFDRVANCVGTRICWYVAPGIYHCEPICLGSSCVFV